MSREKATGEFTKELREKIALSSLEPGDCLYEYSVKLLEACNRIDRLRAELKAKEEIISRISPDIIRSIEQALKGK